MFNSILTILNRYAIFRLSQMTGAADYGNWRENPLFPQYAGYDTEISGTVSGLSSEICGCAVNAIGEGITGTQGLRPRRI